MSEPREVVSRAKQGAKRTKIHATALTALVADIDALDPADYAAEIVDPLLTQAQALAESNRRLWQLIAKLMALKAQGHKVEISGQDIADYAADDQLFDLQNKALDQISYIPWARFTLKLDAHLFEVGVKEVVSHEGGAAQLKALRKAIDGVNLER